MPKQSVQRQVNHDATSIAAALSALNDRIGLNGPVVAEDAEIIDVTVV